MINKLAENTKYVIKIIHAGQNSMLLMQHEQGMHCYFISYAYSFPVFFFKLLTNTQIITVSSECNNSMLQCSTEEGNCYSGQLN